MPKGCVFYYKNVIFNCGDNLYSLDDQNSTAFTHEYPPARDWRAHKPKSSLFAQYKYYSTGLSRTPIQAVSKLVWTMSRTFKHIDLCGWTTNEEDGGFKKSSKNLTPLNIIHFYFVNDFDNM